ncbi:MAG TPA: hypothetical protein VF772_17535 [Terriglobales bacterium]
MSFDRREFVRLMLGAGVGLVAPSKIWPFRKIFLPPVLNPAVFTITASNAHLFKKGDRVRIYRTAAGLDGEYYLVDEIAAQTGILTFNLGRRELPPIETWVGLETTEYMSRDEYRRKYQR